MVDCSQQKQILSIITFLLALIFMGCRSNTTPIAINGVIDLKNVEWGKNNIIALNGEWDFYWNKYEKKYSKNELNTDNNETIIVPGAWKNNAEEYHSDHGYGWYRITIKNIQLHDPALYIKSYSTAFDVYINGKLVGKIGESGISAEDFEAETASLLLPLPAANEYNIALFASSFQDINGGLEPGPLLGNMEVLRAKLTRDTFAGAFVLGIIFIMIIFHVILWLLRKEDKTSLFFSFFCLVVFLRYMLNSYHLYNIFHPWNIFELNIRILYLSTNFGALTFILFLTSLFPGEFKNRFYRILVFVLLSLSFFIFFPVSAFTRLLLIFQIPLIVSCCAMIVSLFLVMAKNKYPASIVFGGFLLIFLAVLNDIVDSQLATYNISVIQYALVVFLFLQTYIVARRYSNAFRKANYLSRNLQKEVRRQTGKIEAQKQELIRVNEERTGFFVNFAHETKTPLTLIQNYLEKDIQKRGTSSDLEVVRKNLICLKNDMLDYLDMERILKQKRMYDHSGLINLSQTLENAATLFLELAKKKQVNFDVKIQPDVYVRAHPRAMDKIINNLLDNAIFYTDSGGQVTAVLEASGTSGKLSVCDTGIGIPPEEQKNIFKPFYQVVSEKRRITGIGIGLSLVQKIIKEIGGSLSVNSTEGEGTEFIVVFLAFSAADIDVPAKTEDIVFNARLPSLELKPIENKPVEFISGRKTILVVEDNKDMLAYLQDSLQNQYNVFTAEDGDQALNMLFSNRILPDLIVSDIMMNNLDGLGFLETIRTNSDINNIPFIFLSARSSLDDRIEALKKGAVDFIAKPFNIRELKAKIASLLENREFANAYSKDSFLRSLSEYLDRKNENSNYDRFLEFGLTARECEVADLVIKGLQNKEIADKLSLSLSGVKKHVNSIYSKCGVNRRIDFLRIVRNRN